MRRAQSEEGQALILGAGIFAAVFVFLAIVIYLGGGFTQRRALQNSADAAALAGAQALNGTSASDGPAIAAAESWAAKNISDLKSVTATVADNHTTIRVSVTKDSFFAFSAFGLGSAEIGAHAKARIAAALLPGPGTFPTAITKDTFDSLEFGELTVLKARAQNQPANGRFQLLDFDNGANATCAGVEGGSSVPITDPQPAQNGNESKLKSCLPVRMTAAAANSCLTLSQVLDSSNRVVDRCNPLIGATVTADPNYPGCMTSQQNPCVQPTAVVLVPIVTAFINPPGDLDIVGSGDALRLFAFFWLHPVNVQAITISVNGQPVTGPTCAGGGQCQIVGQFVQANPALVAGGVPVGDYNSDAVVKVVQLIE
jgi:Flp pilus assembly protein TadG